MDVRKKGKKKSEKGIKGRRVGGMKMKGEGGG
jgi:hypothetical protein